MRGLPLSGGVVYRFINYPHPEGHHGIGWILIGWMNSTLRGGGKVGWWEWLFCPIHGVVAYIPWLAAGVVYLRRWYGTRV